MRYTLFKKVVEEGLAASGQSSTQLGQGNDPKTNQPLKENQFKDILRLRMPKNFTEWIVEVKQDIFIDTPRGKIKLRTNLVTYEKKREQRPHMKITEVK